MLPRKEHSEAFSSSMRNILRGNDCHILLYDAHISDTLTISFFGGMGNRS